MPLVSPDGRRRPLTVVRGDTTVVLFRAVDIAGNTSAVAAGTTRLTVRALSTIDAATDAGAVFQLTVGAGIAAIDPADADGNNGAGTMSAAQTALLNDDEYLYDIQHAPSAGAVVTVAHGRLRVVKDATRTIPV